MPADGGFEAVDDGFESVDEPPPQAVDDGFEAVDDGFESKPDVVNLGFSQKDAADKKLQKNEPLQRRQSHYFWLNIGKEVDAAAIGTPRKIDLSYFPPKPY